MSNNEFSIANVEAKTAIAIRDKCITNELGMKYDELFTELGNLMKSQSLEAASPSFSICYEFSSEMVDIEAGIPVSGNPVSKGRINVIQTYGGKAVMKKHYGPYEKLHESWNALENHIKENNFQITGFPFEVYVVGARQTSDSSRWQTEIYFPIKG